MEAGIEGRMRPTVSCTGHIDHSIPSYPTLSLLKPQVIFYIFIDYGPRRVIESLLIGFPPQTPAAWLYVGYASLGHHSGPEGAGDRDFDVPQEFTIRFQHSVQARRKVKNERVAGSNTVSFA